MGSIGPRPNGNHLAPLNLDGGKLWSCNFALRRDVFESLRGFDETFPHAMEDCDLHLRLKQNGARIHFVAHALVRHPWRSLSESEISRQIIGHAIYARKHREFAREWGILTLLRMLRQKQRLYMKVPIKPIPLSKYRAVLYDICSPLILTAVVHLAPLRNALARRYQNKMPPDCNPPFL